MAAIVPTAAAILGMIGAAACSARDEERNVILETAPFYQSSVRMRSQCGEGAIQVVRNFAKRYDLDFLIAQQNLGPGGFNASANGPTLNLIAMHVEPLDHGRISVSAISRGQPTEADRQIVAAFELELKKVCQ